MKLDALIKPLITSITLCSLCAASVFANNKDIGWDQKQVSNVLDNALEIQFSPDISHLSANELKALEHLKNAGSLIHEIYLSAQHKEGLAAKAELTESAQKGDQLAKQKLDLYRIFKGPIATTLDNKRQAFVNVTAEMLGKNRYPWGITKSEVTQFLESYPEEKDSILHPRTVVKKNTASNIKQDLASLAKYPVLDTLHPGLKNHLKKLQTNPKQSLYALPYSVAYADRILKIYQQLNLAAKAIKSVDKDFSDYLKNRARDLLSDDYESGDAAWITGNFGNINAQIGSYETYDDSLFSTKTAFSMSILIKDRKRSDELAKAIGGLQEIENSLPYKAHKTVRSKIPIGVYNVLVDYAQSRGTNTASILPNENYITQKYGRVILLRYNVLTSPEIFATSKALWDNVVSDQFKSHLTIQSNFKRTLWHEIGHYMGPGTDKDGRPHEISLQNNQNLLEEMKSDLVSLYAANLLHQKGYHTDEDLRAIYAGGVMRTLLKNKPRRSQSYAVMRLMTMNFFLENRAISFDAKDKTLSINYKKYPQAVKKLLTKLLDIQYQGDKPESDRFIEKYTQWNKDLHGVLANKMKSAKQPSYRLIKYETLGEAISKP